MIESIMTKGKPDADNKSCYDCTYCQAAVSWWCVNVEAVECRGTAIPGVIKCPFWKAVKHIKDFGFFDRLLLGFNPFITRITGNDNESPTGEQT